MTDTIRETEVSGPHDEADTRPVLSVIIPIFNEVELLPKVLEMVRALPLRMELILVDDFSTDGTRDILKAEESVPGTRVMYHDRNRGKGAGIVTGLAAATGDVVIVQDADLEYDPREIPGIVEPIFAGKANVAFGSRFMGKVTGMKFPNRVANWILSRMVSVLYGRKITDEATAYKAFRRDLIQGLDLQCQRFEFCPEVTAKVLRRGENILEVPITYNARTFEEGKKIGYRDFFVAVDNLWKFRNWN